jgi:hypothetical protein
MQWTNLAEIESRFDPRMRLSREQMTMRHYQEQAKLEQSDRHHSERLRIENRRIEASAEAERENSRAIVQRETIAGRNALDLANRNHLLGQFSQGSQLIDSMIHSQLKQEEDWNNVMADTMRQLLMSDADTIKQTKLKELDHKHKIEELQLTHNLAIASMVLEHEIKNLRVSFDKSCDLIFKIIERVLGFGDREVQRVEVKNAIDQVVAGWEMR